MSSIPAWLTIFVAVSGITLVAVSIALRERASMRMLRFEADRLELEYKRNRQEASVGSDDLFSLLRQLERTSDLHLRASSELSNETGSAINQIRRMLDEISDRLAQPQVINNTVRRESDFEIVSEIAHSLKTQLAHMEGIGRQLFHTSDPDQVDLKQVGDEIIASINVCKATLATFQEISSISSKSTDWSPSSLQRSTHAIYLASVRNTRKSINFDSYLPDSIPGYSNNLVLGLLLPIIENAIEEAPDGSDVVVDCDEGPSRVTLTVSNQLSTPFDHAAFSTPGRSTKVDHDGIGVSTVQHLLSVVPGSEMYTENEHEQLTVTIRMPRRITND